MGLAGLAQALGIGTAVPGPVGRGPVGAGARGVGRRGLGRIGAPGGPQEATENRTATTRSDIILLAARKKLE